MKILVVGSCGKRKRHSTSDAPNCEDIQSKHSIDALRIQFPDRLSPAREMYTGNQSRELVYGVDLLREICGLEVTLCIISAGFGVLRENDLVPPYDCTFSGMRTGDIKQRSENLSIVTDFQILINSNFHLVYLALGKSYLFALGTDWYPKEESTIILFGGGEQAPGVVFLPANVDVVKAYSQNGHKIHGIAGFKGDLLRILAEYALNQSNPYLEITKWSKPEHFKRIFAELGSVDD